MKSRIAIAAAAVALASLGANATEVFHAANNEAGSINHVVPGKHTRAEHDAIEAKSQPNGDAMWVFAGEGAGWQLKQHAYVFQKGRFVHADQIPHDTKAPDFSVAEAAATQARYGGS